MKINSNNRKSTQQFLINCLQVFLKSETPASLKMSPKDMVDWDFLLHLAAWHRVTPLLYRSLHDAGLRAAPVPVLSQIEAYVRSAARTWARDTPRLAGGETRQSGPMATL